ncbi:MAG: tetratricopeptide repeat protein [Acidobacteria bacterium]|nr:tetratricopeptide repeat protein [Acidobacteriota bacterium]
MRIDVRIASVAFLLSGAALTAQTKPASPSTPDRSASYYHYGLAHIYEDLATSQGRSDYATQAIEEYKLALAADPNSAKLQDGLAELYFKLGRSREAVQVAQEQVKKDPEDADAHALLGQIYFRSLGEMQNGTQSDMVKLATQEYETLVRLKPNEAENHLLLGRLYELQHDSVKAEMQFKRARQLEPDSQDSLLDMARLYSEQGDLNRVVTTLSAIPETDRGARVEYALGATYDQLKDYKHAAEAYQRAIDNDGDNPETRRALGNALLSDGQLDKAEQVFSDLVKADAQDAQSTIRLAEVQRRQGHYQQALDTLKQAEKLMPDSDELVYNEALTYDALGMYSDAERVLNAVLAKAPKGGAETNVSDAEKNNRAIFLDRLGIVYREENKTDQAVQTYAKIIALGGEFATRGYQGQIDAYRDAHMIDKATEVAAAAAKAFPKDRNVQQAYGAQLADSGKAEEGIALVKAQLNGKTEDRDTYVSLAQMYIRLRRWQDAASMLDKAEAMTSKDQDKLFIYFLRGNLADRQKHYDDAEKQFRKVLKIDPNNASAMNYLGYMFADHDMKLQEAVSLLKKAVELDPQNGSFLDSLGWAYFKLGQYKEAEEYLQKAVNRSPDEAAIHDHLGEVYEKTGRLKQAVAQWERSLAEYARTPQGDVEPDDVARIHHRLDATRVRLAKVRGGRSTP